jgi:hypothetical protein
MAGLRRDIERRIKIFRISRFEPNTSRYQARNFYTRTNYLNGKWSGGIAPGNLKLRLLNEGELIVSRSGHFGFGRKVPDFHCTGG